MSKITRRSFKRKKIIMGASLFGATGLVSTGFAAWVLSSSAKNETEVGLHVGTITDNNLEFLEVKVYKGEEATDDAQFYFEPLQSDTTGRLHNDGVNFESITFEVKGGLKYANFVGTISAEVKADDDTMTKIRTAESYGLITMPYFEDENKIVYDYQDPTAGALTLGTPDSSHDYTANFAIPFAITWGSAFGGDNPGEFFDGAGADIPQGTTADLWDGGDNTTKTLFGMMNALHSLLDGLTLTLELYAVAR